MERGRHGCRTSRTVARVAVELPPTQISKVVASCTMDLVTALR
jgi:hypothetical protein